MKFYIKLLLVSFILFVAIYSCKKDTGPITESSAPNNPSTITTPDSIYHKVLSPYVILNPISNLVPHGSGCGMVYYPKDSTTTYDLDLDSNGVGDLHFSSKSYYEFHSASYPCANYLRATNIDAINVTDSLGWILPSNNYQSFYYSLGDTIGINSKFSNYTMFSAVSWGASAEPVAVHGGDFYLPLKRVLNNKTMYGWIKIDTIGYGGIIIKEYAINKTNNNKITCGQTH